MAERADSAPRTSRDGSEAWTMRRKDPEKRAEGAGDQWRLFVALIQLIWRTGGSCSRCSGRSLWSFPKVLRGATTATVLQAGELGCLNLSEPGRSQAGPATRNLMQRPLYGIFIDLLKAYDAMNGDRCMEIMEGYGVGPNI
ncbi:hypothetical protein THAOC_28164 [Thalassiosira oceanica]|uniref:Reverse transcriptase domain-containing protein n=1 Tax=Thalassiosira oceanica TaxID=159749 RepID=K0S0X1_THAOC|nr:hypothetical protein THAOC_28164 [Thalassiosira oceanica]|eukprot:EJK52542.1 hypothetical protein THAOC_28164 [Thalassiosira oceanica]